MSQIAEAILLSCVRQSARGVAALQFFVVKEKRNNINTSGIAGSPRRRLCRIVVIAHFAHPNGPGGLLHNVCLSTVLRRTQYYVRTKHMFDLPGKYSSKSVRVLPSFVPCLTGLGLDSAGLALAGQ